jgi:hypothetical protein
MTIAGPWPRVVLVSLGAALATGWCTAAVIVGGDLRGRGGRGLGVAHGAVNFQP